MMLPPPSREGSSQTVEWLFEKVFCGRRRRLVPRRWHQVRGVIPRERWRQNSPVSGSANKPLKPFACGMPGVSGVPAVSNSCAFYSCTGGRGCIALPASPTPSRAKRLCTTSGAMRCEIADACLNLGAVWTVERANHHCSERWWVTPVGAALRTRWANPPCTPPRICRLTTQELPPHRMSNKMVLDRAAGLG